MPQPPSCESLLAALPGLPQDPQSLAHLQQLLDVCGAELADSTPERRAQLAELLATKVLEAGVGFCPLVAWSFSQLPPSDPRRRLLHARYLDQCKGAISLDDWQQLVKVFSPADREENRTGLWQLYKRATTPQVTLEAFAEALARRRRAGKTTIVEDHTELGDVLRLTVPPSGPLIMHRITPLGIAVTDTESVAVGPGRLATLPATVRGLSLWIGLMGAGDSVRWKVGEWIHQVQEADAADTGASSGASCSATSTKETCG